jgi:hypothetical protein
MASMNILKKSPVRGPAFKKVGAFLDTTISYHQPKGEIFVWLPSLIVANNTRRLVQVSKSACQAADKWTTPFGMMNNAHDRRLRTGTIDRQLSFVYVCCRAKHSKLEVWMRCHHMKQLR